MNLDFNQLSEMSKIDALKWLTKEGVTPGGYQEGTTGAMARAAQIMAIEPAELINDVRSAIVDHIKNNGTKEDFVNNFNSIMSKKGWAPDPDNPLNKPYRIEYILKQNIDTAYSVGRWNEATSQSNYLKYNTQNDNKVRDTHKALEGIVKHKDDEFWKSFFPPWEPNCRCFVTPANFRDETLNVMTVKNNDEKNVYVNYNKVATSQGSWGNNVAKLGIPADFNRYPGEIRQSVIDRYSEASKTLRDVKKFMEEYRAKYRD